MVKKKKYLPNLIGEKVEIEDIIFSANVQKLKGHIYSKQKTEV